MGIGFVFKAISKNVAAEIGRIESMATTADCLFEEMEYPENHTVVRLEYCPGGELFLNFKDGNIFCDVQTNIAGPGFHVDALEFLQVFAAKEKLDFQIEDETDFFLHKDFDRMRREHFYPWFEKLLALLSEQIRRSDISDWLISWPMDTYTPLSLPGTVSTPMGRYRPDETLDRIEREGIENVMADYFVWPDREKNARFYRNCAFYLMWTDVYFMPSRRSSQDAAINERVIALLEKAAEMDTSLPFPHREYEELCSLHGIEPRRFDANPTFLPPDPIGYRRDVIKHVVGLLLLPLPGHYLHEEEESNGHYTQVFYDARNENWHTIHLTMFELNEELDEFVSRGFENVVEPPIRISGERIEIQAAWLGFNDEDDGPYYSVLAEIHSGKHLGIMSLVFERESEKDWAFSLLKTLSTRFER